MVRDHGRRRTMRVAVVLHALHERRARVKPVPDRHARRWRISIAAGEGTRTRVNVGIDPADIVWSLFRSRHGRENAQSTMARKTSALLAVFVSLMVVSHMQGRRSALGVGSLDPRDLRLGEQHVGLQPRLVLAARPEKLAGLPSVSSIALCRSAYAQCRSANFGHGEGRPLGGRGRRLPLLDIAQSRRIRKVEVVVPGSNEQALCVRRRTPS